MSENTGQESAEAAAGADKAPKKPKRKTKREARAERLEARVQSLPRKPGCYLMKGTKGEVFYVGKAADLRARVRSYFRLSGDSRSFIPLLDRILDDIEIIVTSNEKEALLLENTLIKEHQPRYNVMLRDDKSFLALRLDTRRPFPRLELVRTHKRRRDRAHYFGPYPSAKSARRVIRVLNRHFQLRVCTDRTMRSRTRPCLQYQIGRCPAPCVDAVDAERYREGVDDAILFLSGRENDLLHRLEERMFAAANEEAFERAAALRDQIEAVRAVMERQHVVEGRALDQEVIGLYRQGDRATLCVMIIQRGRLIGSEEIALKNQEFPDAELLSSFLPQRYEGRADLPDEVLLPLRIDDAEVIAEWLTEQKGRKVAIRVPRRGPRRRLVEMAGENAIVAFQTRAARQASTEELLERLQRRLRLGRLPRRIEGFDISNLQGEHTVGSMVVFEDGEPVPSKYRHFRVRGVSGPNDYASLYEVLSRRFARALQTSSEPGAEEPDDWDFPDLLVIDGGKGQLGVALAVLSDLGIPHGAGEMEVVSLAKERVPVAAKNRAAPPKAAGETTPRETDSPPRDAAAPETTPPATPAASQAAETSSETVPDRVFLPNVKDAIRLRPNTAELFVLARLRDEAHRFAIRHHRALRRRTTLRSSLQDIPGIGPKRAAGLLRHFGSLRNIRAADRQTLAAAPGMNAKLAESVRQHFRADEET